MAYGFQLLAFSFWLLAFGFQLLAFGFQLLADEEDVFSAITAKKTRFSFVMSHRVCILKAVVSNDSNSERYDIGV